MKERNQLRWPLARMLRDPVTPERKQRVRDRVFSTLAEVDGESEPQASHAQRSWRWSGASWRNWFWGLRPVSGRMWLAHGALALTLVLALWRLLPEGRSPGPLLTLSGEAFAPIEAGDAVTIVDFADGSRLRAETGTRVLPLISSGQEFALWLDRGTILLEVQPLGPRRWSIETKLGQVQVVGTKFSVTSDAGEMKVSVTEGSVVVSSPSLTQRVTRLVSGQSLRVEAAEPGTASPDGPSAVGERAAETPAVDLDDLPGARSDATAEVGSGGTPAGSEAPARFERLRQQADAARRSGDLDRAASLYGEILRDFPAESRLPLVLHAWGSTVARAGDSARAAELFERALALGPSASLQEDLLLRLVESKLAVGDRTAARAFAARYQREFPEGRHRQTMESLLGARR